MGDRATRPTILLETQTLAQIPVLTADSGIYPNWDRHLDVSVDLDRRWSSGPQDLPLDLGPLIQVLAPNVFFLSEARARVLAAALIALADYLRTNG